MGYRHYSYVNVIVFCRKSEFCEYITSLHIQHSIYVRQFEFFVFTMKQIASIFCNLSFAGQYTSFSTSGRPFTRPPNFATYIGRLTRFSQVFSYIIQLRRKDSRESCVT